MSNETRIFPKDQVFDIEYTIDGEELKTQRLNFWAKDKATVDIMQRKLAAFKGWYTDEEINRIRITKIERVEN